jgi:signal transduction histidine kinase
MIGNQRVLLASIGHDLRTPITSLRLKSEFIDDDGLRAQFQGSLDELQALTEAALDAARNGVGDEEPREVDVSALTESLCVDLSDMGQDVTFAEGAPTYAHCRPNEIRRAARNLVENAIKYGIRARVRVNAEGGQHVSIIVDDDGPGLQREDIARVFEPFVRLSSSSNGKGHGLGLTLARTIARAHGGDIKLENRGGCGLSATLTLRSKS